MTAAGDLSGAGARRVRRGAAKAPVARSAVTNGSRLFIDEADGRSPAARRFRDLVSEIASDLGGPDRLSEGQRQLVRRAAMIALQCELMEARAVSGEAIDLELFGTLTDRLGRTFQRIGLRRVAKDVTPDLRAYAARKGGER